jgi:hypothetical protein
MFSLSQASECHCGGVGADFENRVVMHGGRLRARHNAHCTHQKRVARHPRLKELDERARRMATSLTCQGLSMLDALHSKVQTKCDLNT